MKRLLITGAAGGLGTAMRPRLAHMAEILRLADLAPVGSPGAKEEVLTGDLADPAAVEEMVAGCDGIVHFGGRAVEDSWSVIRPANIDGMFHLYEAARKHGVGRIFFASSNHVIGFYPPGERLDGETMPRPDTLYGLSKAFGEDLARLYWDKFGIETLCLRIGSCFARPKNRRMLSTWMSYDDMARLIEATFAAEKIGWMVLYGASDNPAGWWDNAAAASIGWAPRDSAEAFRAEVEAESPPYGPDAPETRWQGGTFAAQPIIED